MQTGSMNRADSGCLHLIRTTLNCLRETLLRIPFHPGADTHVLVPELSLQYTFEHV